MKKNYKASGNVYVFNSEDIKKKQFEDRWVKFAFGPQGFIAAKDLSLGIVSFAKNKAALNHNHDVEEALFVLSGSGKIKINERIYPFKKNSFAYIPAGADHQVITQESSIKIFFVFGKQITITH